MRKRKALIGLLILFLIGSIVFFISQVFIQIQETSARYAFISVGQTPFSTSPFYFDVTCSSSTCNDMTIPLAGSIPIEVKNFSGSSYNTTQTTYTISISDGSGTHDAYNFSVDGVTATDDTMTRTINGGSATTDSFAMSFTKTNPSSSDNDIYVTLVSSSAYVSSPTTFKVTVDVPQSLNFTVTGNPTNWTNQDVTLTAVPDDANIPQYSFDDGATWQSNPSKTFSTNQTVCVKIRNSSNQISPNQCVSITKIDKTPPTITVPTDKIYTTINNSLALSTEISASDSQSGLNNNSLIIKRSNSSVVTNANEFTSVGWYKLIASATDNVGNINTVETSIMVRPPTGGHYVLFKQPVAGVGKNTGGSTSGLFQDNADTGADANCPFCSQYYYSGPTVNNYFSFASSTNFRIVNIPTNYNIKIIGGASSRTQRWSDDEIFNSSQYTAWQTWWNNRYIYYDNNDSARLSFSATDASHIANATFYAGSMSSGSVDNIAEVISAERTNTSHTGGSSASFTGHFAYPNISDYLKAGNKQETIYSISTASLTNMATFRNSSWLGTSKSLWTMNGDNAALSYNYFWALSYTNALIQQGNQISGIRYSTATAYQPVFYITEETILSGTGTSSDPFTVRENWDWFDNAQTLQ
ncbi:hypothetical protein IKG45_01775 [Candidatus Saccharibacteria bacterium]|nr:hypothetical protein [Candidatus Saccharibacteria bacterium]